MDINGNNNRLLTYLPAIYSDDPFMEGFLAIFDSILMPLERQIGQLHAYFNPQTAPLEFLPWLGSWVDLVLDENWPEARRRKLIQQAADLYRRRGTAGGLHDYLQVYMDVEPEIKEDDRPGQEFHFTVTFRVKDPRRIDQDRIRRIIEEEKPSHTTYTLIVEKTV